MSNTKELFKSEKLFLEYATQYSLVEGTKVYDAASNAFCVAHKIQGKDSNIIKLFMKMSVQSLDPESWEALNQIVDQLKRTRNIS